MLQHNGERSGTARPGGPERSLQFQVGGIRFSVTTSVRRLLADYEQLYGGYRTNRAAADAIRIRVRPSYRFPGIVRHYAIHVNDQFRFAPTRYDEVLPYVEWSLNWEIPKVRPEFLQLHAASLELDGKGLVLAGDSGVGKSTLTAALVARGWGYLCDEFALIDARTLDIHPYPRAICIKRSGYDLVEGLGIPPDGHRYRKGCKGLVRFIDPLAIRPGAVGRTCPARLVVFPKYSGTGPATLIPIKRAQAALELHRVCFNLFECERLAVDVLADLASHVSCYRLISGDLESTCDTLDTVIRCNMRATPPVDR